VRTPSFKPVIVFCVDIFVLCLSSISYRSRRFQAGPLKASSNFPIHQLPGSKEPHSPPRFMIPSQVAGPRHTTRGPYVQRGLYVDSFLPGLSSAGSRCSLRSFLFINVKVEDVNYWENYVLTFLCCILCSDFDLTIEKIFFFSTTQNIYMTRY
jgi:hypothetical protein